MAPMKVGVRDEVQMLKLKSWLQLVAFPLLKLAVFLDAAIGVYVAKICVVVRVEIGKNSFIP